MNNKKLIEKILKEETKGLKKDFDKTLLIFDYIDAEEMITKTIASKDAQKDLFVKKLKEEWKLKMRRMELVSIEVAIYELNQSIDKLAKEVFE